MGAPLARREHLEGAQGHVNPRSGGGDPPNSGPVRRDSKAREKRWLTPGVQGIGAASLLSDLGHEVPTALLPRLITSLGGSAAALGLIEGISDGLSGLARLLGGAVADDPVRRRSAAVGGYMTTAILSGLIGAATSVWQVGVLRAGAWAARGLRGPARNALLAEAVPSEAYGRAYGFERAMDNLGAIGGPVVALALVAVLSVRTTILLSTIPGLLAVAAIFYALRHISSSSGQQREHFRIHIGPVIRGPLGRLLVGITAFELGNIAATLLILRSTELLEPTRGASAATSAALLLYLAYNVAASLISIPAGQASDRIGPVRVLACGVLLFLIAYLLFLWSGPDIPLLAGGFVLAGMGKGCAETAEHTAVAVSSSPEIRGSAFGVLAALQSFGNLAASGIAGIVWSAASPDAAFSYLAAWMGIALTSLFVFTPSQPSAL